MSLCSGKEAANAYLRGSASKASRLSVIVKLTPKGFDILDQAIPLWKEAEDEIFSESKKYSFSVL